MKVKIREKTKKTEWNCVASWRKNEWKVKTVGRINEIIGGKGKARIEFSPPNNTLIVANGKWIIFHDPELDRTTYLPLKSGILKALLDPESFQNKKNTLPTLSDGIRTMRLIKKIYG